MDSNSPAASHSGCSILILMSIKKIHLVDSSSSHSTEAKQRHISALSLNTALIIHDNQIPVKLLIREQDRSYYPGPAGLTNPLDRWEN